MSGIQTDILAPQSNGSFQAHGSVASKLLQSEFNVNALRTNNVLRKEEWLQFDEKVVNIARQRLVGVADLLNAGLSYGVGNALGTTMVEWEQMSDMAPAQTSMSGITEGQNDRVDFALQQIPLPIIHKDFHINIRALEASRKLGQPLDTTQATMCARLVSERIESLLFTGGYVAGATSQIHGYTTATNRNTGSVTATWVTATGQQIVGDVISMIDDANDDHMYGPYGLYVPVAVFNHMADDYKSESDKTIKQRVEEIPGISWVKPSSNLTGTNVVLVQMTDDVVDMINGIQPTVVQWETHGGMQVNFKVMAIMVPRIKDTKSDQSGIVHYS